MTYISWSSDSDFYLKDILMEECWTEDWFSDIKFDLQTYMWVSDYILQYRDSALYFQYYLMKKPLSLDISSDMSHRPVFHD